MQSLQHKLKLGKSCLAKRRTKTANQQTAVAAVVPVSKLHPQIHSKLDSNCSTPNPKSQSRSKTVNPSTLALSLPPTPCERKNNSRRQLPKRKILGSRASRVLSVLMMLPSFSLAFCLWLVAFQGNLSR